MFAKKLLFGAVILSALLIVPATASAYEDHRGRPAAHDDHDRRPAPRDDHRRPEYRDDYYRRPDYRDYRAAAPAIACAPAPVPVAPAPVVVNVPVTVNVPPPAPVACTPSQPVVITPSYKHWEVLCRTSPDHPWQITSEFSNRPDAENAANNLEAQGYDTMLRVP